MQERSEVVLRRALKQWRSRQRNDGCLAGILVILSSLTTLRFVLVADAAAAFVMGLFLVALLISCLRLLNSAARVVEIRKALYPVLASEIIDVEVLAPMESRAGRAESSAVQRRHLLN